VGNYYGDIYQTNSVPAHPAGKEIRTPDGRCFKYMQNTSGGALAKGNLLKLEGASGGTGAADGGIIMTGTLAAVTAIGARRVTDTAVFTTTSLQDMHDVQENGHVYMFWTTGSTGVAQGGPIIRRVSDTQIDIYDWAGETGAFATALAATTTYAIQCFTRVELTEEAADIPVGTALTAVADDEWFWMQTEGLGIVLFDTSTATTLEEVVLPGAEDGHGQGIAAGGTAAVPLSIVGRAPLGMDVDADGLLPLTLCMRQNSTFCRNDRLFPFCMGDYSHAFPRMS